MTQFVNVSFLCVPVHKDTTQIPLNTTNTTPAFSTAAFTAIVPNLGAGKLHSVLLKDPIGVLTALAITTS